MEQCQQGYVLLCTVDIIQLLTIILTFINSDYTVYILYLHMKQTVDIRH